MFLATPLLFDALLQGTNEYPHKPYIARNKSHWATFLLMKVLVYLHSNFCGGLQKKHMYFETKCIMLVKDHLRSLI